LLQKSSIINPFIREDGINISRSFAIVVVVVCLFFVAEKPGIINQFIFHRGGLETSAGVVAFVVVFYFVIENQQHHHSHQQELLSLSLFFILL
jgi:hypothetical protein